ncbi:dnaJ subfamily C member 7 isoform X1 [Cinnamomum micranthum f. kanehirae]|uniref:DnaJ subfamily C member 7 isoform X1 n=1 Tax=Cinnamomum micranthum f. kanehirae TaxID=337451 RepID=A0A443PP02_9MAGN|nr:dnaJ subfamily C member 7 isoform X1 [Cinnamomum micranthum f. kanehirae]
MEEVTGMFWEEEEEGEEREQGIPFDFDLLSLVSAPKDHYKILEVDYDATDETIRSNYIRLAMKWHPDKRKDEESATTRFQEINEAYQVLSDPVKREEYDRNGIPKSQELLYDGVPSSIRGPDIDLQWPWDQTFNMVNC